ncbi:DUF3488 and transglutaminase-like domain-containing protein [Nostocoides sp. Soil756]|uniref:transglutaminase family protein n=1 Tax=Nostocoides sp. Soil756 TaxID=1736399 RepID=UPI0006F524AB|nr:DUF3488 and transglutaminase-like domain-containing protein [Tetrasphaera sp. Soil756]KRE61541.1 hypothetical protein ASG78_09250 [Tetrasphaera sp. Soil756]
MSRARGADVALAALAALVVTLPLSDLFTPTAAWARPCIVLVLAVALSGIGLRALTSVRPLVVAGQALVLVEAAALLHGQGHLAGGLLPTLDTARAFGVLFGEAYQTVTQYSAPAPADRGTTLAISVFVGLTALAVDAIAVTYRSPALAGLPLLTAFLAAATNTTAGLAAWMIVPPALVWLAMVGRQGVGSLRAWGGTVEVGSARPADPAGSFATVARSVGVLALATAVVLPGLVPHLPPTFLADGLARGDGGTGTGGSVRLSTSVDIARDLAERSADPVLVYRTTADDPEPLRVALLDTYRRGRWLSSSDATFVPVDGQLPGSSAGPEVTRTTERIEVTRSGIGLPQVALPANAIGAPFPAGSWRLDGNGVVELTAPAPSYTVDYEALTPTAAQFAGVAADLAVQDDLRVDPDAQEALAALLQRVTEAGQTPLQKAVAIQAHLRSSAYTYSEDLVDETAAGRRPEEPLVRFLETRRGYCVQFATAMIMLAREAGIPARMAVGFLPGRLDGDERVIRADDAHAWPELYFPQLGWMRFEPTPGVRSGVAPVYSSEQSAPEGSALPVPTSAPSASSSTPTRPRGDVTIDTPQGPRGTSTSTGVLRAVAQHWPTVLGVLGVLLVLALTPLGAWLARRRAQRRARDDAERVEAQWQSLLLRLGDIGLVPGDGATPRQASRELARAAYLTPDEGAALGRVVDTLERARYARPGADLPDVAPDADAVWRAALGRRRRSARVRALFLPEEGRRHWRSMLGRPGRTDAEPGRDEDASVR